VYEAKLYSPYSVGFREAELREKERTWNENTYSREHSSVYRFCIPSMWNTHRQTHSLTVETVS